VPRERSNLQRYEYDGRYFAHQKRPSWTGSHKKRLVRAGINQFANANWSNGRRPEFFNHQMIELVSFKAGAIAGPARRGGPPPLRRAL